MKPQGHVAVSAGLGVVFWARSRDVWTLILSLVFGVLIDVDHLVDYFYAERRLNFDFRRFMNCRHWQRTGRLFLLFHAFEYLPVVYFFWRARKGPRWAVAATAAMSVHILADHFVNELKPLGYFILYRVAHGFRASEIIDPVAVARVQARKLRSQQSPTNRLAAIARRMAAFFC